MGLMDLQWMMSAIMVSMIDDLCWCHTWTTQYYLTSTATRDGWRQHIDMITTQPQLSSQLLCRCCPGLGGSAPAARRGSAASGLPLHRGCECQRGHMGQLGTLHNVKAVSQHWPLLWWQVWPRDMLHMVTRQDTWVTKTKPHLTPAHHSWDDARLIHPSTRV